MPLTTFYKTSWIVCSQICAVTTNIKQFKECLRRVLPKACEYFSLVVIQGERNTIKYTSIYQESKSLTVKIKNEMQKNQLI